MTESTAYYLDWLAERYRFDVTGRNTEVENKFLQSLPSQETIALVDVGAGGGSNCRYLMEKIETNQHWLLIEQNPEFSQVSLQVLQQHASHQGHATFLQNDTLIIKTPVKTIQIMTQCGSLLEIDRLTDLSKTDAVVANAVFDLFTENEFDAFVSTLASHQLLFFFTLNYENMHFSPDSSQDEKIISLYHDHMVRPQKNGTSMGPTCVPHMIEILQKHHYAISAGSSIWHIKSEDEKMMRFLFNFMESSIAELPLSEEEAALFRPWRKQKENSSFSLTIEHQDILAYF